MPYQAAKVITNYVNKKKNAIYNLYENNMGKKYFDDTSLLMNALPVFKIVFLII